MKRLKYNSPNLKLILFKVLVIVLFFSCQQNDPVLSSEKTITSFSFLKADNPGLSEDVAGVINGQSILFTIPSGESVIALKPTILHTGSNVNPASGMVNDFTADVTYSVVAEDGSSQDYTISVSVLEAEPVVYVAGGQQIHGTNHITLWKNGVAKNLTNGTYNAYTNSMFVTASTVYVAGYQNIGHSWATYWMDNGIEVTTQELNAANNPDDVQAYSIYVSDNNDVYAVGGEYGGATVWKNGTPTYLTPGAASHARAVFVSGNDVYVAGWVETATGRDATIWKNGVASTLSDESQRSEAYTIFVSDKVVYVAGLTYTETGNQLIKVWKNGAGEIITPDSEGAQVSSVFVSDGDVYLAGLEIVDNQWKAKVWKNGTGTVLSNVSHSYAQSICVNNGDVYVAGWVPDNDGNNVATLWKNGTASVLAKDALATTTYAWSVMVK